MEDGQAGGKPGPHAKGGESGQSPDNDPNVRKFLL
jgi:hypothetical protein